MKRLLALCLALCLLCGCGLFTPQATLPPGATGDPPPTCPPRPEAAEQLTWLHGFYAISSYEQLSLADKLDAVSLGWARMCFDAQRGPWVNTTSEGGNGWVTPKGSETVLEALEEKGVGYPLSVFTSQDNKTVLPDGTQTNVLVTVISEEYRDAAIDTLVAAAERYSGLTVDFEGLASGQIGRASCRERVCQYV